MHQSSKHCYWDARDRLVITEKAGIAFFAAYTAVDCCPEKAHDVKRLMARRDGYIASIPLGWDAH